MLYWMSVDISKLKNRPNHQSGCKVDNEMKEAKNGGRETGNREETLGTAIPNLS